MQGAKKFTPTIFFIFFSFGHSRTPLLPIKFRPSLQAPLEGLWTLSHPAPYMALLAASLTALLVFLVSTISCGFLWLLVIKCCGQSWLLVIKCCGQSWLFVIRRCGRNSFIESVVVVASLGCPLGHGESWSLVVVNLLQSWSIVVVAFVVDSLLIVVAGGQVLWFIVNVVQ